MKPSIWDLLTGIVVLAIAVLACAFTQIFMNPTSGLNPFPPPTAVVPIEIAVVTSTSTSPAPLRELPPTWTPTPTQEIGPTVDTGLRPSSTIPPTATMFIMPTGTPTATSTSTPLPTRADARCYVIEENPKDNTEFNPGQEFDKRWTLRNRSGEAWRADVLDFRYLSGTRMHTGADAYDLPYDVANNDTYVFTTRMRAPTSAGTYTANWTLAAGDKSVCNFFVKIVVK